MEDPLIHFNLRQLNNIIFMHKLIQENPGRMRGSYGNDELFYICVSVVSVGLGNADNLDGKSEAMVAAHARLVYSNLVLVDRKGNSRKTGEEEGDPPALSLEDETYYRNLVEMRKFRLCGIQQADGSASNMDLN